MKVIALERVPLRSVGRVIAALAGVFVLFSLAGFAVLGAGSGAFIVAGLGLVPVAVYVALRWPIVFPFGLYLLLVPFDALLRTEGGAGATVTKFVGFAVIAALLVRTVLVRRALLPPATWFAWAAFTFFAVASLGWSVYAEQTQTTLAILVPLFALYTLAAVYPVTTADAFALRRIIELAGVVIGVYGIYAYFTGQRLIGTRLSLSQGKIHVDPNHYAAFFVIPVALVAARFLTDRRTSVRIASACALALFAVNVFFSGSRGGFVGIGFVLLYLGVRTRKYVTTALIAVTGLAMSFAIPNVWLRFADPTQGDNSGRNDIWAVGLHAFPHYWFAGSGFATYAEVYDDFLVQSYQRVFAGWSRPSHNLIVGTAVELGIVGLGLVLLAWWTSVRQTWGVPAGHPLAPIAYAAEAACAGLFVCALTIDMLWYKYLWVALMLVVLTANAIRQRVLWSPRERATASAARPPVLPVRDPVRF